MISEGEMLLRLLLAVVLGALVGLEREKKNQSAGLRTHIIVILGAALVMLLSKYGFWDITGVNSDPGRLAAQVISGIGFLGAGTIIVHRNMVRGLTTAASLWTTACIGLAIGAGFYVVGIGATVLLVATLFVVHKMEYHMIKKQYKTIYVTTDNMDVFLEKLEEILLSSDIALRQVEAHEDGETEWGTESNMQIVRVLLQLPSYVNISFLLSELVKIQGVYKVEESNTGETN